MLEFSLGGGCCTAVDNMLHNLEVVGSNPAPCFSLLSTGCSQRCNTVHFAWKKIIWCTAWGDTCLISPKRSRSYLLGFYQLMKPCYNALIWNAGHLITRDTSFSYSEAFIHLKTSAQNSNKSLLTKVSPENKSRLRLEGLESIFSGIWFQIENRPF